MKTIRDEKCHLTIITFSNSATRVLSVCCMVLPCAPCICTMEKFHDAMLAMTIKPLFRLKKLKSYLKNMN